MRESHQHPYTTQFPIRRSTGGSCDECDVVSRRSVSATHSLQNKSHRIQQLLTACCRSLKRCRTLIIRRQIRRHRLKLRKLARLRAPCILRCEKLGFPTKVLQSTGLRALNPKCVWAFLVTNAPQTPGPVGLGTQTYRGSSSSRPRVSRGLETGA